MPVIANEGQATLSEGGSSCRASGFLEPTIAADRLRGPLNRVVRRRSGQQVASNSKVPSREGELWKRHSGADGRISSVVRTGR